MTVERRWWVLIWVIIYTVLNTGSSVTALVWAPATEHNLVLNIEPNYFNLQLAPYQSTLVNIKITNWSTTSWRTGEFYLQTILPGKDNSPISPIVPQLLWSEENKTLSSKTVWSQIDFGGEFNFQLPLTAPTDPGKYRLYLQPIINQEPTRYLITVDLRVGKLSAQPMPVLPEKRIEVSLADQTTTIFEGPWELAKFVSSTGKPGWETPPGRYVINKKLTEVFSDDPINLWLPNWMELRDLNGVYEGYGIHGVPYRLINSTSYQEGKRYGYSSYYTEGKLYTGYFVLGKPISQGCVVLPLANAEALFSWVEPDKTLVNIQ